MPTPSDSATIDSLRAQLQTANERIDAKQKAYEQCVKHLTHCHRVICRLRGFIGELRLKVDQSENFLLTPDPTKEGVTDFPTLPEWMKKDE